MNTTDTPQLPEYVCTRRFQAAKISQIGQPTAAEPKMYLLILELGDGQFASQKVHEGYIKRNWPQVGGYFLRTEQGHARYLSAEEFEQDYAAVPDMRPITLALLGQRETETAQIVAGTHPTIGALDPFGDTELLAGQVWEAPLFAEMAKAHFGSLELDLARRRAFQTMLPDFLKSQVDLLQRAPLAAESENLNVAPDYSEMLDKQGRPE